MLPKITSILISLLGIATWFFPELDFKFKIIITLSLIIIGLIVYLIWQERNIRKNKNKNNGVSYDSRPCSYGEKALQAKNSIFCSSIRMAALADHGVYNDFANVKSHIPIKLVLSSNNINTKKALHMLYNWSGVSKKFTEAIITSVDEAINNIRNKRSIDVKYIDFVTPTSYFAIDYKEETDVSFIQIKHYLLCNKKNIEALYFTVYPSSDLYNLYKRQIELLENTEEESDNS